MSIGLKQIAILGSRGFPSTYSGYETLVRHLARDWTDRGLEVTVYCRFRRNGRSHWEDDGVRCRWTPGIDTKTLSTLTFGLTSHADASRRQFDAALVLNIANGFWLPLLRSRGVGTVVNTDGIEWERGKWGKSARRTFLAGARAAARHADVLVADSREIGRIWESTFGVDSRFIPYGGEVLEERGVEALPHGLEPSNFVLAVARVTPENNVDLFLDAAVAPPLAGRKVVMVGTAVGRSSVSSRLQRLHADGRIVWLGHVDDQRVLRALWANCGAYFHGHSVGGTNPSLLQAMGAGAPVLAVDTPFNREVLGNSAVDQILPAQAGIVAARLAELLGNHAKRGEFASRGKATVAERYRWSHVSDAYLDALRSASVRSRR